MKTVKNLSLAGIRTLADSIAKKYENKDAVIGLIGELGAGKTTFTKAFAKHFKVNKIKSPTFIIGSLHKIGKRRLYHYDFYRLETKTQLEHLGFDEILKSKNRIIIIEWVDKFPNIQKQCDLIISFENLDGNKRNVTIK